MRRTLLLTLRRIGRELWFGICMIGVLCLLAVVALLLMTILHGIFQ